MNEAGIAQFTAVLGKANDEILHAQLERAEKEMPELHSAYNLLCAILHSEIQRVDSDRRDSMLRIIPPVLLRSAINLPWNRAFKAYLCEAINRWYAHVYFENWRRGIFSEPGHLDC